MADLVNYLSALFESLKEPFFFVDSKLLCLYANRAMRELVGMKRFTHESVTASGFWPSVSSESFASHDFLGEFVTSEGEKISVKLAIVRWGESGWLTRVVEGSSRSENLARLHGQRLETLGMLAGGVAHDFNNILAGILGHTTYLRTILPERGPHVESLVAVEEGGRKASVMTQQILNFSRHSPGEKPTRVNLNELISKSCILLRGAISPAFTIEQRLLEKPAFVLAPEGALAQVLINLVINARDALSQNGTIRIELELESDERVLKQVLKVTELSAAHYIKLSVVDNGHGMAPDVLKRIFEPYFSTKREKGTGLGLSTVQAIARGLGGVVEVFSEEGNGTKVTVYIPEVKLPQESPEPGAGRQRRLQGGDERILVVDDEVHVRNVLVVSLQHLGYRVESVASGIEALEKYTAKNAYDLVILDMLMPKLPGEKVFAKLKEIDDKVRVLCISGYSSEEAVQSILKGGGLGFIQKPFTIDELAKKVRECLDS